MKINNALRYVMSIFNQLHYQWLIFVLFWLINRDEK